MSKGSADGLCIIRLDVFGRDVLLESEGERWRAYYYSGDGKRRPAHEIHLPVGLAENELVDAIADLCHEWATPAHNEVRVVSA